MANMSYTGRDIVEIRKNLVDLIPTLTDKWRDFNESDLGMTLLELIAGVADMQNFYLDTQAFETYLDTAVQDKNIRSLLRTMNYRIPLLGSARGEVRITYNNTDYKEIDFPKYTQLSCSKSGIKYVVADSVYVTGNMDYIDIAVMEGEYKEKIVSKKILQANTTSNGNISRRIYLGNTKVADGSVEIVQDGEIWTEVTDAILEYNGGYYFSVHKDSTGEVYILMSCNFMDLLPTNIEDEIKIKYVVCKGRDGIVKANDIDTIVDGSINQTGIVSIGNLVDTYGAYDEPDLQRLKILARRQAQTMDRYITLDDYKNGVATEPYVMRCVVKDWKSEDYVDEPYLVKIWAVDWGGVNLGEQNKESLTKKLTTKGVTDVTVSIQTVNIIDFDINVDLYLKTGVSGSDAQKIRNAVTEKLTSLYDTKFMDFGTEISLSMLNSQIKTVSAYIKEAIITSPASNIEIGEIEFPKLNNVHIEIK